LAGEKTEKKPERGARPLTGGESGGAREYRTKKPAMIGSLQKERKGCCREERKMKEVRVTEGKKASLRSSRN